MSAVSVSTAEDESDQDEQKWKSSPNSEPAKEVYILYEVKYKSNLHIILYV